MSKQNAVALAVRRALVMTGTLLAATPFAFAQDQEQTAPQEVVVTGSRIAAPNITSTSPIQVITSEDIQLGGKSDISDVLSQMPQIYSNMMGQDLGNRSSGLTTAGGVATADLRGLGPNRTLVLVNGRRLGAGSPNTAIQSPAPDLDQIPTALVERVDVITGGASAVYGSDAVAGVVNFIMKRNFAGFQVDYHVGQNWHENHSNYASRLLNDAGYDPVTGSAKDGHNTAVTILAGTNFSDDKGNLTAYFGYLESDGVPSGSRDFGGCQLSLNTARDAAVCSGSPNSNRFGLNGSTVKYAVVGDQFVPWGTVPTADPPPLFNSQQFIYMGRADKRYTAGFMGHLDLSTYVKPYVELAFMNDRTTQQIAPTALFENSNPLDPVSANYNVNCSNPLLSAQQASILCTPAQIAADAADPGSVNANVVIGRRNVEGGGRQSYYEHTNYRAALGAQGDITETLNYDVYAQYYYTQFFNSNDRYMNFASISNSLQVKGTAANPVCISGSPCVPYNIFKDGAITPDQLDYLYLSGTAYGTTTQRTLHADITAELGDYHLRSPWARDGLAINLGFEHRNEEVVFSPDSGERSGLLAGFGGAQVAIDNDYSVDEAFTELRAPLLQDRPGVKELVFDTGFRRSDYSTAGVVNTRKFELQYAPTDDFRFRGSYQHAIRAPSIIELFNPEVLGQIQFDTDPCAPTLDDNGVLTPAAASLGQCLNTGVTQAQYGNGGTTNIVPQLGANQITQLAGGNTSLEAETGKSYSWGVTLTPQILSGFTGSIDYYRITLEDAIGTISPQLILSNCLNSADQTYCSQIVRSNTGSLQGASVAGGGYIIQRSLNIGETSISGVDVQTNYRAPPLGRWGTLAFALNGTWIESLKTTPLPGAAEYDCVGLFGPTCARVTPRWRHNLRTTWNTPWDLLISANWRYIGSTKLDANTTDPSLQAAKFNSVNPKLPTMSYLDLSASYTFRGSFEVRGGVNNVLDKDPPIVTSELISGGAANSYELYDGLGRQLFLAVTAKF